MTLECQIAYYSFALEGPAWTSAKVSAEDLGLDAHDIRAKEMEHKFEKGCWHCSYCFPRIADVINKLETFHKLNITSCLPYKDPAHIVAKTRAGLDLFDRDVSHIQAVDIDAPSYVRAVPRVMLGRWPSFHRAVGSIDQ